MVPTVNAAGWVLGKGRGMGESRVSIGAWWDPEIWARARAAYVYDLDHHPDAPAGFIQWLHWVIELHIRRDVQGRDNIQVPPRRELAARPDPDHPEKVAGLTRHHPLRADLVERMDHAIAADRQANRYRTRSAWLQDAVTVAIDDAEQRSGGRLPTIPDGVRLPNQPTKTGRRGSGEPASLQGA